MHFRASSGAIVIIFAEQCGRTGSVSLPGLGIECSARSVSSALSGWMEQAVLGVRTDHDINTQMFSAVCVVGNHRLYTITDGELRLNWACVGLVANDRDATDREIALEYGNLFPISFVLRLARFHAFLPFAFQIPRPCLPSVFRPKEESHECSRSHY